MCCTGCCKRLTWIELRSALILAVMTAVVLPLLPDRTIDPWGGFNPWQIWFFTVLTAAISYLGYLATRILGEQRGLLVSALAGAVVSSTAVTVALARTAKAGGNPLPLAGAASLAAAVSILRVCVIVALVKPSPLWTLAPAALVAALCFAACGALLMLRSGGQGPARYTGAQSLRAQPAPAFAVLFAIVSTASAALAGRMGSGGLLATSALSGTFDVDVAVLSTLRLVGQSVSSEMAGTIVLAALAANAAGRSSWRFWQVRSVFPCRLPQPPSRRPVWVSRLSPCCRPCERFPRLRVDPDQCWRGAATL